MHPNMSTKLTLSTEDRERERRRAKYKYALVRWGDIANWEDAPRLSVEQKSNLAHWWTGSHEVLCDDQPYKVLKGMLKLLKEEQ